MFADSANGAFEDALDMAAKAEETVDDELEMELTGDELLTVAEQETSDDGTKADTLVAVIVVDETTVDETETLNGAVDIVVDEVDVKGLKDGIGGPSQENEDNGEVFAEVSELETSVGTNKSASVLSGGWLIL